MNKEITAQGSAREILALSEARLTEWDQVNVLTALHRVAKSADRTHCSAAPLPARVHASYSQFGAFAIANAAWALAALNDDSPLLHALAA
mmetsp:Transcript_45316/g.104771  ORF Transcript_45316/g.104771 Transcript_45316/m.104771 type:complete len:90 (+) Transcript_45316:191-460(+)